jgi:hypothetical protein
MSTELSAILGEVAVDTGLWRDFLAICACGGRVAGTESEARTLPLLKSALAALPGAQVRAEPIRYLGWRAKSARLTQTSPERRSLTCNPLLRGIATPPGGLEAEVLDLGRGTPETFDAMAAEIRGRIVMVRHEYMFADGTIHRRRKYGWAEERGAAGFLIACPHVGIGPVAGSTGREGGPGLPALGIDAESAARLGRTGAGLARVRMEIDTEEGPAEVSNLIAEIPGQTDEWIVLSAHIDGHSLAESAMDNATGLAAALAAARALAPRIAGWRRGLRICFFTVEEWALTGSRVHVEALGGNERARMKLNVNLDSVGGHSRMAALTSGFAAIEPFLAETATAIGLDLRLHRPLMPNSDHYNFATAGIPALRLVAGFDEIQSNLRYVLTPADTVDKVAPGELKTAALLTAAIIQRACTLDLPW